MLPNSRIFLRIWSHLLKKSVMENLIFCAVLDLACICTAYFIEIPITSVTRQKSKLQSGSNKKTKRAKFSKHLLNSDTQTNVCLLVGPKCSYFWKIWLALFSFYLRFEIRPFAFLPTILSVNLKNFQNT